MSAVNVTELEKIVSKQRNEFRPEDLFELTQNLGYQSAYQDKTWQVFTRDNEFVAVKMYRPIIRKMAYPVSGQFEGLDEAINLSSDLRKIEEAILRPYDPFAIMACGGAATGLMEAFVVSFLEIYHPHVFSHPGSHALVAMSEFILIFLGLAIGQIIGERYRKKRSQLLESVQNYLFGHEAVKYLLSQYQENIKSS